MYCTKWLTEWQVNPSLWLPRNQHDSTLACKMQGSLKWHEFKTEEVRKILLQLSCQAKPSSPWGYSCPWIVMFSVLPALQVGKVQPYKRGSWCLPVPLAAATALHFVDLEVALTGTTEAARLAGWLLFIRRYFQPFKWLFCWFDLCHQLSQLYDLTFCSFYFYGCSLARAIL